MNKKSIFASICLLFSGFLFINMTSSGPELILYVSATGSSDANDGTSVSQAVRSLDRIKSILIDKKNSGLLARDVKVVIAGGNYYCRHMDSNWDFFNPPYKIRFLGIEKNGVRPTFSGHDQNGNKCDRANFLLVKHGKINTGLTIEGLKITRYKGGITVIGSDEPTKINAEVTIKNIIFENIGSAHYSGTPGKGAILFTRTRGNTIENNQFINVQNSDPLTIGMVHGIYFTSEARVNLVKDNNFLNITGSAIKITDFSNSNIFIRNEFTNANTAIVDRWCGAGKNDDITMCPGGVPQCPSWDNRFDLNSPAYKNIIHSDTKSHSIYPIPVNQTCRYNPPDTERFFTTY